MALIECQNPETFGYDEAGKIVKGKTWVTPHVSYKDQPEAPKVVYIETSLASARRQVELARVRNGLPGLSTLPAETTNEDACLGSSFSASAEIPAFVYVMRNPSHGRNVFKGGFTEGGPEQRAAQLSRETSSPTQFLVVEAWGVTNGRRAEASIHSALDEFRIDDRREFFRSYYQNLRSIIGKSIQPLLS